MAQTTTTVTATFPFPELTKFASELQPPTHATLQVLQRELNSNAMSVHSNFGGGRHGHLTLTIPAPRYLAITNDAFPPPVAPPVNPVIPAAPTAAINEALRQHQEHVRTFRQYHDTDKALVRCILAATPSTYVDALCDVDFGYANVTTLQLVTHLHDTYGALTPADRDNNLARMQTPWSPPTPIEVLFQQLEESQRFALAAAEPIADTVLTRIGYQIIIKTGMFADGCRDWRLLPEANQTWAAFKTHFARQERDRHETATAASTGYSGTAFHVQAVGSPPPPSTNTALAATILPSGPELLALLVELRNLRASTKPTGTPTPSPPAASKHIARGYCWTHGSTANATHSSSTCKNKAPGHVDTATWRNQLGGNPNAYVPHSRRTDPSPP
jgi:hypothetical protein